MTFFGAVSRGPRLGGLEVGSIDATTTPPASSNAPSETLPAPAPALAPIVPSLGDAARLGGSSTRAVQAFASLRQRFPGSPEAAAAAFLLGRIAQDQSRDYAGAAGWYARYLSEQPGGGFAADAAGRLVEAEDRRGDEASARRAAERYLAAYPSGSHAAYAKSVRARGSSPPPPGDAPGRPGTLREPSAP